MRLVLTFLALIVAPTSAPLAECANYVRPPLLYERANWVDVERLVADQSLNSAIDRVQKIKENGQGEINIDQYAITIDADGQSAEDLFKEFRKNLGEVIFGSTRADDFYPFAAADKLKWASDNPLGAVMIFRLETLGFGIVPLERGAVVMSCIADTDFIFSTVKVGSSIWPDGPGWHPVSGNRAFGVRDNGDESLTIFVKAADRVTDVALFNVIGNETIFEGGHKVWLQMLRNIEDKYKSRKPRDKAIFSKRLTY